MNKILQTALVLAILATNGLAGDIANGGAFDKGHTVEINTEIGSTITATFNANTSETSDLTITSDAKLTNKGTVEMGGGVCNKEFRNFRKLWNC